MSADPEMRAIVAYFDESWTSMGTLDGGFTTHSMEGSGRWQAYELINFDFSVAFAPMHTVETDVWAFGMLVYVGEL